MLKYKIPQIVTLIPDFYVDPAPLEEMGYPTKKGPP